MTVLIFIDNTSHTEKLLRDISLIMTGVSSSDITVLHVTDEQLFFSGTGYETELGDNITRENKELFGLCKKYLGDEIQFRLEFGVPRKIIMELVNNAGQDLLVFGRNTHKGLDEMLVGNIPEYIVRHSRKPVLIMPT